MAEVQSFWDHIEELRGTLIRSVLSIVLCSALGLIFRDQLFAIVLGPSNPDFFVYRLLGWDFKMELINVDVSAQFFVHLKAACIAGVVLAFPYVIWEIWKFISPALYNNEKKPFKVAFLLSSVLFYLGAVVGYVVVLPICLQFFMNYTISPDIANTITISSYMSSFTSMVLLIGLAFEFPTVILVLGKLGVLDRETMRKGRKYAFAAILIVSAIITPTDPFSMLVLAAPLYLLYEFSILLCPKSEEETA